MTPQPITGRHGLTKVAHWHDMQPGGTLTDQLKEEGVTYQETPVPYLAGMGGAAYLVTYASPSTGETMTVLLIPLRGDVDAYAESYYYFAGLTHEAALTRDWGAIYDDIRASERTGRPSL